MSDYHDDNALYLQEEEEEHLEIEEEPSYEYNPKSNGVENKRQETAPFHNTPVGSERQENANSLYKKKHEQESNLAHENTEDTEAYDPYDTSLLEQQQQEDTQGQQESYYLDNSHSTSEHVGSAPLQSIYGYTIDREGTAPYENSTAPTTSYYNHPQHQMSGDAYAYPSAQGESYNEYESYGQQSSNYPYPSYAGGGGGGVPADSSSYSSSSRPAHFRPPRLRRDSDEGKLFIGGLSWDTTDENLYHYFAKYGKIIDSIVMKDGNGKSRGFAFVTYEDPSVVDNVMAENHVIDGKQVDPKPAIPREAQVRAEKMFVGSLPESVTEPQLAAYFSRFGKVIDTTVMVDHQTGEARGFGFVTFESESGLANALDSQPHRLASATLEVKKALPKTKSAKLLERASASEESTVSSRRGGPGTSRHTSDRGAGEGYRQPPPFQPPYYPPGGYYYPPSPHGGSSGSYPSPVASPGGGYPPPSPYGSYYDPYYGSGGPGYYPPPSGYPLHPHQPLSAGSPESSEADKDTLKISSQQPVYDSPYYGGGGGGAEGYRYSGHYPPGSYASPPPSSNRYPPASSHYAATSSYPAVHAAASDYSSSGNVGSGPVRHSKYSGGGGGDPRRSRSQHPYEN